MATQKKKTNAVNRRVNSKKSTTLTKKKPTNSSRNTTIKKKVSSSYKNNSNKRRQNVQRVSTARKTSPSRNTAVKRSSTTSTSSKKTTIVRSKTKKPKVIRKKVIKLKKKPIIILLMIIGLIIFLCNKPKIEIKNSLNLKLNGNKKIVLEYGKEYEDEGAIAKFNDVDLTKEIKVVTNINFKKIGTYYYKYMIEYDGKCKEVKRDVLIKDTTKPTIKLNGDSKITIYVGSKYTENGATATDNYDGDITKKISTSGKVNTKKAGTYTITYKVSDSSKNETSIKRTIVVKSKPKGNDSTSKTDNTSVPMTSSKGFKVEKKDGLYYVGGVLVVNKTYNLPSNYNPKGLQKVFTTNFNKMKEDASKAGVSLKIISGFRSYETQKILYNNYVKSDSKANADRYSARPGHSEHQTGLAADINNISYTWDTTKEGKWLNDNCYKYGFVIRYPKNGESKTGYMFEPWHIRYLGKDLAKKLYNNGNWITLEEYLGISSRYNY